MQKKQYVAFCLFLIFCGLAGIIAHFVVTADFVANYLTIDGEIDPGKRQALNRLRVISLVSGGTLMGFSVLLLVLSGRSQHPLILHLQKGVSAAFSYDLATAAQNTWSTITPRQKKLFGINLLVAFLSHGFVMNNLIINWDGQNGLDFSSLAHLPSGRWFTAFLGIFSEHHFLPIPFFVVSVCLLARCGMLFASFWGEKPLLHQVLLGSLLISFPSFAAGLSYNWVCAIYPISCFFTLLAIKYALQPGYRSLAIGVLCFVLMLGTYQGFMAFGYAMMLATVVLSITFGEDTLFKIKRFAVLGLLSPLVYKLVSDVLLLLIGMEYYDYRGADQIGLGYILTHFPENFVRSYETLRNFFTGVYFSMPFYQLAGMLLVGALCFFVLLLRLSSKEITLPKVLLILVLALLSPPIIFATQFLNTYIDTLLVFGMIPILGAAFYMISSYKMNLLSNFATLLIFLVVLGFVNRSNSIHLKNYFWTETSLRLANDIALKVGALPDFSPDKKLVRFGDLSKQNFPLNERPPFDEQGMTMVGPTGLTTWGESRTLNGMMSFLGFGYETAAWASVPETIKLKVGEMPVYPREGSIQVLGDFVVLKLGEKPSPDSLVPEVGGDQ